VSWFDDEPPANDCAVSEAEMREVVRLKRTKGNGPVWVPRQVWEERVLEASEAPPGGNDYDPLDWDDESNTW
jgi:hypothetical protein